MTITPWPDHLLTLAEWAALDLEPSSRYEVHQGVLIVAPRPHALHQRAMARLATALDAVLPSDLTALADFEIVMAGVAGGPATVRVPDVVVLPERLAAADPVRLTAADVLLAIEIASPGTRRTDRMTKLGQYADAGIPHYWILELGPPVELTAQVLVDGDYEITARCSGVVNLLSPVPLLIDLETLVTR